MKFKKFVLKHRYLFLFFLIVSIPLVILADFSLNEAYQILPGDVNKKIYQRQSDNTSLSSKAVCIDASDSAHAYFVGNKTKTEIESFFTSYYSDPSKFPGVTIKTGCCVDGICDEGSGENFSTCWDDCNAQAPTPCSGNFVDSRDGQSYPMVTIGEQCWMGKNINIGTRVNHGTSQTASTGIQKYCYENNDSYCNTYGGLYQWNEAMQGSTLERAQGICPSGWHIPTFDDFRSLESTAGNGYAGENLKATYDWADPGFPMYVTNSTNFTALPTGWAVNEPADPSWWFEGLGQKTTYWSSTNQDTDYASARSLYYDQMEFYDESGFKPNGLSVRCVRNTNATKPNYTLNYLAGANGTVTGSTTQIVIAGGSGTTVTAVANPSSGYKFYNWSDGVNSNPRTDTNVNSSKTVTANFTKICPTSFTDSRDGNVYHSEYIAGRCWMTENLRYLPTIQYSSDSSNASAKYYVYDYVPTWFNPPKVSDAKSNSNYTNFGVLYNWTAASTACPSGWSLPSNGSVYLNSGYNLAEVAGTNYTHLKIHNIPHIAALFWNGSGVSGEGDNSTLFSALPGGSYDGGSGNFNNKGTRMHFWASTQCKLTTLCSQDDPNRHLSFTNYDGTFTIWADNFRGYSVRCVKSY